MALKLNAAETDALIRNLDGLTDMYGENYSVELSRRDSLDNEHEDGFLVIRVQRAVAGDLDRIYEDAVSGNGATSSWTVEHYDAS